MDVASHGSLGKPTHQSKMPDAFLVLHHCLSPFLKSSPLLAFGSLSGSLHPASVQAGGASAGRFRTLQNSPVAMRDYMAVQLGQRATHR
jgi:hypothetical protein